jgi:catalase
LQRDIAKYTHVKIFQSNVEMENLLHFSIVANERDAADAACDFVLKFWTAKGCEDPMKATRPYSSARDS